MAALASKTQGMLLQKYSRREGGSADTSKLPAEGRQSNGDFANRTSGFNGAFVLSVLNRLDDRGVAKLFLFAGREITSRFVGVDPTQGVTVGHLAISHGYDLHFNSLSSLR
jgi:hypothetical protein